MPPWTSLVDLLLVPLAKSIFSTSATLYPRATASRATPAPVTPPPITSTSNCSLPRRDRLCMRTDDDSGCIIARSRRYERAKQGRHPIAYSYLRPFVCSRLVVLLGRWLPYRPTRCFSIGRSLSYSFTSRLGSARFA